MKFAHEIVYDVFMGKGGPTIPVQIIHTCFPGQGTGCETAGTTSSIPSLLGRADSFLRDGRRFGCSPDQTNAPLSLRLPSLCRSCHI